LITRKWRGSYAKLTALTGIDFARVDLGRWIYFLRFGSILDAGRRRWRDGERGAALPRR